MKGETMKVTTVTATIKYSQDTGKGAWKAVEIGADATVDAAETWQQAQASLYHQLGCQLKTLWNNGKGAQNGSEGYGEAVPVLEPQSSPAPPEHYCQEHQTEYKRYERQGKVWYSHKGPDGKWCKESN